MQDINQKKKSRSKQLTLQYLLAVGIIFILSLSTLLTLEYILAKQDSYASIINISGRQRMLSQRTTLLILHLFEIPDSKQKHLAETRKNLLAATTLMEESHKALTSGRLPDDSVYILSQAINDMYFSAPLNTDALVSSHIETIKMLLTNPANIAKEAFFDNATTTLLSALNTVVKQYELESNQYTNTLKHIELAVFFITLLVLLTIIIFIFRPMVRSVVENEDVLNNMLDQLPVFMDIVSENHTILYQSKSLVKAMGANRVGRKCYEVYKDDGNRCEQCPLSNTIANDSNIIEVNGCLEGRTLQVAHVHIHFHGQPAILETFSDVTEQRQTEQLLIQAKDDAENASKIKSEFLASMSHEIKTPLNAIIGLTYLTLETSVTGKQGDYLNKITASAKQLSSLVSNLLDFSKIENHALALKSSSFNLGDTMDQLASITTCNALEKGLEVNFNIEADVPLYLVGDHHRLEQILGQLIENAIKFTKSGYIDINAAHIKTEDKQITLRFSVDDTGIGIDEKQASRLFQLFSQGEESNTRHHSGTGLGLALCKELINLMGGELHLETKSEPGSTFSFNAVFSSDDKNTKNYPHIPELTGLKALVVDDHPMARRSIEHMLSTFHLQVKTSASAKDALAELKQAIQDTTAYDFIITDWQMPEMNGIDFAAEVRKNQAIYGNPAILLVTAHSKDETVLLAEKDFDGLLLKPVNRAVLLGTILTMYDEKTKTCSEILTDPNIPLPYSLPGIDMQRGQAQIGGSQKLYSSILKKFACNQAEQINAIRTAHSNKDMETTHRLIHTLKGVAGNIGAFGLHDTALQLEKEFSTEGSIQQELFTEKLNNLNTALQEVLASINSLHSRTLDKQDQYQISDSRPTKVNLELAIPILTKLADLLKNSDTEAEQHLDTLTEHLHNTKMESEIKSLSDLIGQYEFEEALKIVHSIHTSIRN